MKEEKQSSQKNQQNENVQSGHQETPKKTATKSGWVRLREEKRFGSVTGGGFRVWGE